MKQKVTYHIINSKYSDLSKVTLILISFIFTKVALGQAKPQTTLILISFIFTKVALGQAKPQTVQKKSVQNKQQFNF